MFNIQKCIVILTLLTISWSYENDSTFPVKKSKLTRKSKEKVLVLNKPIKNFTLTIPRHCEELGICEHIPDYPKQIVWRIIKRLLRRNVTFNTDVKQWEDYADYFFEDSPRNHEDADLCKSKHKLYFPEAARDVSQRWRVILNSPRTPQNFIGDQCESNHQDCSKIAYFMTPFYRGVCVQKYMKRVMYGLNEELNGVIKTLFEVPSCCACVARRIS